MSPVRVQELVEPEEPRPFEMDSDNGESPESGIQSFALPQPVMDRMPIDISRPKNAGGSAQARG